MEDICIGWAIFLLNRRFLIVNILCTLDTFVRERLIYETPVQWGGMGACRRQKRWRTEPAISPYDGRPLAHQRPVELLTSLLQVSSNIDAEAEIDSAVAAAAAAEISGAGGAVQYVRTDPRFSEILYSTKWLLHCTAIEIFDAPWSIATLLTLYSFQKSVIKNSSSHQLLRYIL